jgi:uncharacterized protein (DUF1684 family)
MKHLRRQALLAVTLISLCPLRTPAETKHSKTAQPPAVLAEDASWRQQLATWRSQREHELAAPDGWLTLVGLEWLKPGVNSFGAAQDNLVKIRAQAPPHFGLLTVSGSTVQLLSPTGGFPADLKIDGAPAREGPLSADDTKPSTLTWHGLTMVVLPRGGRFALRIKDADSPTRTGFHGLHWYAPDERFRVTAKWIPFTPPHVEKIPTIIGTTLNMPAPGIAEFNLNGKTLRLEPVIEGGEQDQLFFILRDTTSRATTYEAARFLHTGLPSHGVAEPGTLTLDFNELYNPPCAYTPYATCPLPPEQNRLSIAIEAGEQRYSH